MAQRLQVIKQPAENWLDWWGHRGGSAEAVMAVWRSAQRHVLEPTPELLARSQAQAKASWWAWPPRRGQASRVLAPEALPEARFQMLWSNLVLNTAARPANLMAAWHRCLAPQGLLMFSSFGPDTLRGLRAVYAELGWPEPHAPFVDMHDLGDLLVHGGFADPVMDQEPLTLNWSSPQAALAELRELGVNLSPRRHSGLRTPRWHQALCEALARRCSVQGRISLDFELVYGHAYKGVPRRAPDEPAVVSLSSLRSKLSKI